MVADFVEFQQANVYGIYGLLGGGKSLTAVEIAIEFLHRGFPVASNIELRNLKPSSDALYTFIDDFASCDWWKLPQGAPRGSSSTFRSAIIIDETAEFFDQNSYSSPLTKNFLSWLRHSSKRGQFVFMIVQQPEFVAKALRLLVSRWICCVDLGQVRLPILKLHIPFLGGYVYRALYDRQGNRLSRGLCLACKKDIGRFYTTSQSIAFGGRDTIGKSDDSPPDFFLLFSLLSILYLWFLTIFW